MANAWIITTSSAISDLVARAREFGGTVTAVTVGDVEVKGVDRALNIALPDATPAEALAPAVVEAVAVDTGDVVLVKNGPVERVFAGALAAKKGLPVLLGLKSVTPGKASLSRFGGVSNEDVEFDSAVVAVIEGGAEAEGNSVAPEAVPGEGYDAKVTAVNSAAAEAVNLAGAKRIVTLGRGFNAKEDLKLGEDLAAAIDAQVASSRPLAEGLDWMGRDTYIGISGQHVAPDVMVSVGISGQIQHTAGIVDSKVIIAINNDEQAPIFEIADYGIVGDLYDVLPALTEALK